MVLNTWHASIRVGRNDLKFGDAVSFLDLSLFLNSQRRILSKTFRKPLCLYDYTPYNSYHPKGCYKSLILGELHRLRVACTLGTHFNEQTKLFKQKLCARGYPANMFDRLAVRVLHSDRSLSTCTKFKHDSVFLSVPYHAGTEGTSFTALHDVKDLFVHMTGKNIQIGKCYTGHKNLLYPVQNRVEGG